MLNYYAKHLRYWDKWQSGLQLLQVQKTYTDNINVMNARKTGPFQYTESWEPSQANQCEEDREFWVEETIDANTRSVRGIPKQLIWTEHQAEGGGDKRRETAEVGMAKLWAALSNVPRSLIFYQRKCEDIEGFSIEQKHNEI